MADQLQRSIQTEDLGKIKAWRDVRRRQSKQIKDLGDIARLIEAHPDLWEQLPDKLQKHIMPPDSNKQSNEDR
jgi:hypothetical protein